MHDADTFQKLPRKRTFSKRIDSASLQHGMAAQARRDAGCRKIAYASKHLAEKAFSRIESKPGGLPVKKLRAVYRCPVCSGQAWHLTSQEQRR